MRGVRPEDRLVLGWQQARPPALVDTVNDCGHSWAWPDSPEVRALGLGVAALRYAELGYAVLPLEPGSKKPHRMLGPSGGVRWCSSNPARIASWWRADPAANIGVACGSASGLAVIDLDVKHDANGPWNFAAFLESGRTWQDIWIGANVYGRSLVQDRYPMPAEIPWVSTPSGGAHLWLRTPPGAVVPERPGILPGVDVKGDGGYVLAPPSGLMQHADGHDGEHGGLVPAAYEWSGGCPCAVPPAPDWVPQWLATAAKVMARIGSDDTEIPELDVLEREGAQRGERNKVMHRTACGLFRTYGVTPAGVAAVTQRLRTIWDAGDKRDFDWHEVLVLIESARKFIAAREEAERPAVQGITDWADRHGA